MVFDFLRPRRPESPPEPQPCCFCAQAIRATERDPVELVAMYPDLAAQQCFYAHEACLAARLHASVKFPELEAL